MLAVPGREREFRHYNSCHTFTASSSSSSSSFTKVERTQGQVVYRRPHSVDLGGVGRARVRQSRAHLTDEFRRVGIGTCLEGGLFSPVFLLVGSLGDKLMFPETECDENGHILSTVSTIKKVQLPS